MIHSRAPTRAVLVSIAARVHAKGLFRSWKTTAGALGLMPAKCSPLPLPFPTPQAHVSPRGRAEDTGFLGEPCIRTDRKRHVNLLDVNYLAKGYKLLQLWLMAMLQDLVLEEGHRMRSLLLVELMAMQVKKSQSKKYYHSRFLY